MFDKLINLNNKIKSKIFLDHDVGKLSWFRTGGKSKVFIIVENEEELEMLINYVADFNYIIIGAASNLLIRDNGFDGIIIKLGKGFNNIKINEDFLCVGASILDINLSKFAKNNLIKDFEFYSGIPGTIGGAIKMNAGCFGSETKDILNKVTYIDSSGKKNNVNASKLNLKYRSSNLRDTDIVTSAEFNISYGQLSNIEKKINFINLERKNKQPLKEKTSGSTFKNPSNYFAAKLIEKAGCKGLESGDAIVSLQHSNFLINKGNATASDIEELGNKIIDRVFKKFNILLDWEIKIVGD